MYIIVRTDEDHLGVPKYYTGRNAEDGFVWDSRAYALRYVYEWEAAQVADDWTSYFIARGLPYRAYFEKAVTRNGGH